MYNLKNLKMKKVIIGIVFLFAGTALFAQTANDYLEVTRGVLKTEKKAAIAEVMQLTEEESTTFWPLYNEYNDKMYTINTRLFNVIKDYSEHYLDMTDEKAKELWTEAMKIEMDLLKLEKTYFNKFLKILPAIKVVRYLQAENKIKVMVDAELAAEVPFFEDMN